MSTLNEDDNDRPNEAPNRRAFLRQAGAALAVGLGITLIPSQTAAAKTAHRTLNDTAGKNAIPLNGATCCRSSCKSCTGSQHAYTCSQNCPCSTSCCYCQSLSVNCYASGCCTCTNCPTC